MKHDEFEKGIEFFNKGDFFGAHEVWERVWRGTVEPGEKHFVQGVIMIAAALHHYKRKEYGGAVRLLEKGTRLVKENKGAETSIDNDEFIKEMDLFHEKFVTSDYHISDQEFPKIHRA